MSLQNHQKPAKVNHYESQKRRDWSTFCRFLDNQNPSIHVAHCNRHHVLDFLRFLDQWGKTKVHLQSCVFFGHQVAREACPCPLRQAWGSLDSLIGRMRAAYEENGGPDATNNPFASVGVKAYLREVKEYQSMATGVSYVKGKRRKLNSGDHQSTHMN